MAELKLGQGNHTPVSMCLSINMVYEKYLYQYKLYIIIRKTYKNEKTNKQTKKQKQKSKTREDIAHEIGIKTSHNKSHWHLKITKVNLKASF
jgi:hypothetical protein